ncbi:MAG: hypothetical protein NZ866_01235 [Patescibacteria group bacterium]|nr:hypothetical protein [Patescibacteria group bacterium]
MNKKIFCPICKKGRIKVTKRLKTRSKYNPTKNYFQYPNIQWFQLPNGKRIKICMKCRKKILKSKLEKLNI